MQQQQSVARIPASVHSSLQEIETSNKAGVSDQESKSSLKS